MRKDDLENITFIRYSERKKEENRVAYPWIVCEGMSEWKERR